MSPSEKHNKRNGIIGTILFHSLLLIAFLFLGLTYQDPPPAEEGISINFGFVDNGMGKKNPEAEEQKPEIKQEKILEETNESNEEIVTQDKIENLSVKSIEEKQKKDIVNESLEEIQ